MLTWVRALIAACVFTAGLGVAKTTNSLEQFHLPEVPRAEWRFQKFPILAWWGPPGDQPLSAFEDYRDAGFNIYPLNPDRHFESGLEKATSAGLAIMPFKRIQGFATRDEGHPVQYPQDHPNIVGWITYDEPGEYEQIKLSIQSVNELMRRDPTRWAMFNCLPPYVNPPDTGELVAAAVRNGMPIISYDNYVIIKDGTTNEAEHFAAVELYRQLSLEHKVPFWAFALTIKHFHFRRASESDLRWKQFTNLAYGAKGLWYFTYWGPLDWENWDNKAIVNPATRERTELYHYTKAINENVLSMGDHLLNLTSTRVMHTTGTPQGQPTFQRGSHWISDIEAKDAIVSLFKHKDGSDYAMIVNKQHGMEKSAADLADTMTISFAPEVDSVEAIAWLDGKPGPLSLDDGRTTMTIGGGTGVLLKMKPRTNAGSNF